MRVNWKWGALHVRRFATRQGAPLHCTSTPTTITIGSNLSSLWYASLQFLNDRNIGPVIIRVVRTQVAISFYFRALASTVHVRQTYLPHGHHPHQSSASSFHAISEIFKVITLPASLSERSSPSLAVHWAGLSRVIHQQDFVDNNIHYFLNCEFNPFVTETTMTESMECQNP